MPTSPKKQDDADKTTVSKYATTTSLHRRGSVHLLRRTSANTNTSTSSFRFRGKASTNKHSKTTTADTAQEVARLTMRARSDSALFDARRWDKQERSLTATGVPDVSTLAADAPRLSHLHPRPTPSHRMSLGIANVGPQFGLDHKRREGFFDVFGMLGVPMLLFFMSTSLAVFVQAYIQVYPTPFANLLMDTTTYDSGEFWMFPEPEPVPTVVATAILIALALYYLYLAALMVCFRHRAIVKRKRRQSVTSSPRKSGSKASSVESMSSPSKTDSTTSGRLAGRFPELNSTQLIRLLVPALLWPDRHAKAVLALPALTTPSDDNSKNVIPILDGNSSTRKLATDQRKPRKAIATIPVRDIYEQFVRPNGVYYAYYNVLYDAPKLIFQSITLQAYLRKGFPIPLTAFYASLLTFNYLISFYRFQRKRIDHKLTITRLFYLFDLFFAAFAPIVVLAYAYYNFHFDRAVYQTKVETLSPGVFDRIARLYADPVEISVFRLAFGSLRLTTASAILIKCSLLLLSLFKWRKIIVYLVQTNYAQQRKWTSHYPAVVKHSSSRRHLFFGIFLFVFFGVGVVLYTAGSILTSTQHCGAYQEHCVVISYRWIFPHESCPCLVYINRETDPRTFAEWVDPPDVTDELSAVAKMGELKVIQIINRKLPALPDTLRACKHLEQLILLYTKTEIIPPWANELAYLQYFHVEGDFTSNLATLPLDLFKHMKKLTYLHTGVIPKLTQYPSFEGLENLQTLAIAAPHGLVELPSFAPLGNLRVLLLVEQASVRRLPSLQPLKNIKQIGIFYRASMCCNGYLNAGQCDLSHFQCIPRADEPPVECVNDTIPLDDAAVIARVGGPICPKWSYNLRDSAPSRDLTDGMCGGVLFRQCQVGNATGMCYNSRMQVVYCDTTDEMVRMRRLQIQRQVGIPCDPEVEAWLGCTSSSEQP